MPKKHSETNVNQVRKSRASNMPQKDNRQYSKPPWNFNIAPKPNDVPIYWEINSSEGEHICQMSARGCNGYKTEKANFDLISHAPELLETCADLVREMCYRQCILGMSRAEKRICCRCDVIVKARNLLQRIKEGDL